LRFPCRYCLVLPGAAGACPGRCHDEHSRTRRKIDAWAAVVGVVFYRKMPATSTDD